MKLNEIKSPRNTTVWVWVKTYFLAWMLKNNTGSNLKILVMLLK